MHVFLKKTLSARVLHARLALAEQDLAVAESYGRAELARQRERIAQLRNQIDQRSADDVRRDVERSAKFMVLQ